ncbi:MAG: phytanoyl-CoA dioxygenase family protein [Thermoanaerobaculia bacterium]
MNAAMQLPPLDGRFDVTREMTGALRRDGHLKVRGFFTPEEIAAYRPHLGRAIDAAVRDERLIAAGSVDVGRGWKYVKDVWALNEITRRFLTNERVGRLAADLLGCEAVRLFRDQSYYKAPGGGCTPWHQDSHFIPLDAPEVVAVWIPLAIITPEMAPMDYVTGSHRCTDFLGASGVEEEQMTEYEARMRARGFAIANYGAFEPGDVAVHYASTVHGSRVNRSHAQREVIVSAYFPDGSRVAGDISLPPEAAHFEEHANKIRAENVARAMPGLRPGDLADCATLPLVYPIGTPSDAHRTSR